MFALHSENKSEKNGGKYKSSNKYRQCRANHGLIISQSNYTAIIAPIISE